MFTSDNSEVLQNLDNNNMFCRLGRWEKNWKNLFILTTQIQSKIYDFRKDT